MDTNLKELLSKIDQGLNESDNEKLFSEIIKETTIFVLSDTDLASKMEMPLPFIDHWKEGSSLPLVLMRKSILVWIKNHIKENYK